MIKEQKQKKNKSITFRITASSLDDLQAKAKELSMSINGYLSYLLNSASKKQKISFEEQLKAVEKREIESRVFFTKSEAELLRQYAQVNDWSITKEIRYRVMATLSKKPKLSSEELQAIYCVRAAINVLGANLNRLVRNNQLLSDHNISVCKELLELIKELMSKIKYLEKCSHTHFKLEQRIGSANGS